MKKNNTKIDYIPDYKSIFFKMISAVAIHQIVVNKEGKPVDYIFLEVNPAFERMTGLKKENIIGKKVTEVIPGTENDPVNWIQKYGKLALEGGFENFENYSSGLKKWFHIYAYSLEKGYFITIFNDITVRIQALNDLKTKNEEYEIILKNVIDRELKMAELKEEIKKLKNQN